MIPEIASGTEEGRVLRLLTTSRLIDKDAFVTILISEDRFVYVLINSNKTLMRFSKDLAGAGNNINPNLLLERTWNLSTDIKEDPAGSNYIMTPMEADKIIGKIIISGVFLAPPK
jgi:hypothetical protein